GEGCRPGGARFLPRLLPLRGSAARRLRHGARARAHAHARPAQPAGGYLPLPRSDPPAAVGLPAAETVSPRHMSLPPGGCFTRGDGYQALAGAFTTGTGV